MAEGGDYGGMEGINFSLSLEDNVSVVTARMTGAQFGLGQQVEDSQKKIDSQNISFMAQYTAVRALGMGFTMATHSLLQLGVFAEKDAASIMKLNAGVHLVVSAFNMLKGAIAIINMLRSASAALLGVEAALAVLRNPLMLGMVFMAVGVGAGIAGYMAGQGSVSTTTVNQNIAFGTPITSDQRSTARGTLEVMGG